MNQAWGAALPGLPTLFLAGPIIAWALGLGAWRFAQTLGPPPLGQDHVAAGRLAGLLYGLLQLAYLFPGLAVTLLADAIGKTDDAVQLIQGLSAGGGAAVTGYWLWRRARLPARWRLAGSVATLGLALIGLGLAPSLFTLTLALVLGAAVAPSSMLVRDTIARQFPGRRGSFLAVSQTWTHATRGLGGLAFAMAILGALDLMVAITALGFAVTGVAGVYAGWSRLEAAVVERRSAAGLAQPGRLPLGRLLGSPSLRKALAATVGIYGCFQLLWAELQPRVKAIGWSDRQASVWVAVFGLAALVSIPWIRRHSRHSDRDATRSATEASAILIGAAVFGLASLIDPGSQWMFAALSVLAVYTGWVEIGGNATSAPITKGLIDLDPRAVLLSSLARHLAAALGGVVAAFVAWDQAVWCNLGFALVTYAALRRWEEHPVERAWVAGPCTPLSLRLLAVRSGSGYLETPAEFTLVFEGGSGRVGPWEIWRRDTIEVKASLQPEVPRSERIAVFRIRFDWTLADRRRVRDGAGGRLFPGARVPLVLAGRRRGTLCWSLCQRGHWQVRNQSTILLADGLGDLELVHNRHGLV